jgi:multidrug efflux pump subunit AcrB
MIRIVGEDLDQLRALAGEVEEILKQHPGTRDVQNPIAARRTDVAVRADAEKAGLLGVPMVEIDRSIRLAIAGLVAGQYRTPEGEEHDIVVRAASGGHPSLVGSEPGGANPPAGAFASLNALDRLSVSSVTGAAIPLRALAKAELKSSAPIIQHHNRERAVNVTAFVETGFNTDRVTQEIIALLGKKRWPQGYRWAAAGEIESRQESFGGLGTAILIAVFGVLAVLVLEFRTFKSTLIVASVIPLGVVGGLVALYLAGMTLSFTATIGFVALIGIEVKNSILLVDFTNQLREQGVSVEEAIRRAGEVRFFPILLTTLTAIGGLLPLALSGSGLYSPLAWVIIGGLISSTILSRLVTPVMYLLLAPEVEAIPATPAPLPGLPATA